MWHQAESTSTSLVAEELLLNGNPSLTSCVTSLMEDVLKLDYDRIKETKEDDIIHLPPIGKGRGGVGGDVVVKGVSLQLQRYEVTTTHIVDGEG
jgi:hypothetical protein